MRVFKLSYSLESSNLSQYIAHQPKTIFPPNWLKARTVWRRQGQGISWLNEVIGLPISVRINATAGVVLIFSGRVPECLW